MNHARELVAVARRFLGVRFVHQGRNARGLDCLGLLLVTAELAGVKLEDQAVMALDMPQYGTRPDVEMLQQKLQHYLVAVTVPQPADILLLNIDNSPQHLAMVTDYPAPGALGMIHAYAVARKVVEHRYDAQWRGVTQQIYRLPQLA